MTADGDSKRFYGTVLAVLADTLAAHDLGGFKSGVGRALRKCRQCMATGEDIQSKVHTASTFNAYVTCVHTQNLGPLVHLSASE